MHTNIARKSESMLERDDDYPFQVRWLQIDLWSSIVIGWVPGARKRDFSSHRIAIQDIGKDKSIVDDFTKTEYCKQ
jgi:hypothetical protein